MKKRIASFLLASLLLSSILIGCAKDTPPSVDTTDPGTVETKAPETESVEDILGFAKEDNNNETFTLLTSSTTAYDFNIESQTGDIVDDAVFKKDRMLEEYLGINIELVHESGLWKDRSAFNQKITAAHSSGDTTYDLINNTLVCTMPLAQQGMFINVDDLPYTNFDQPWYIRNMLENYGINGKFYGILSDHTLSLYKNMSVVFFNSTIWEAEKQDVNLYDLVRSGDWTLDKFMELTQDMSRDLNGDSAIDMDNDRYAYLSEGVPNGTWILGLDIKILDWNKDGMYIYHGMTERIDDAHSRLVSFYNSVPGIDALDTSASTEHIPMKNFAEGRVAMMTNFIYATENIRNMDDDYGIIPIPKYDKAQENYITAVGTSTSTLFVPQTQMDLDLVSKFIECAAYFSYTEVSPVYYETALKTKYVDDPNIAEMLDMVRESATIDFLFVHGTSLKQSPTSRFRFNNDGHDAAMSAYFAKTADVFVASLDAYLAAYDNLE